MQKKAVISEGKAKTLYESDNPDQFIMQFRDDASAFDGQKKAALVGKGRINNLFNATIMQWLNEREIPTHFIRRLDSEHSLVKRLQMLPVECVIRNRAAGSLCRRLGCERGYRFQPPLFEFFLKDDALHDPIINEAHILAFKWATEQQISEMKRLSFAVNSILAPIFAAADMLLVDFKLEFGAEAGRLVLGDEFSPDGCRVWDANTLEVMDKDRFRQELGGVVEHYILIAERLGIDISN